MIKIELSNEVAVHAFLNKEIKQAIITLGGKGRRIKVLLKIPKPLYQ